MENKSFNRIYAHGSDFLSLHNNLNLTSNTGRNLRNENVTPIW